MTHFHGHVDPKGKLHLVDLRRWQDRLQQLAGKPVVVTLDRPRKRATESQRKYYWGVIVEMLANELGYTKEEMHEALKYKFLRTEAEPDRRRVLETVRSTEDLSTTEREKFHEDVRMWAARDLGIVIPLPNEVLG